MKLFLKGERCFTEKCAVEKRSVPPGVHGRRRRPKERAYGQQLREKQKVRRIYGVLERQFRNYFKKAAGMPGKTGENLLVSLELRLDTMVQRMGFASSRAQARQLVLHGHVQVNGKRVNIPSAAVSVGDEVALVEKMKKNLVVLAAVEQAARAMPPTWLEVDREALTAKVKDLPKREELVTPEMNEQLIVELYSR